MVFFAKIKFFFVKRKFSLFLILGKNLIRLTCEKGTTGSLTSTVEVMFNQFVSVDLELSSINKSVSAGSR